MTFETFKWLWWNIVKRYKPLKVCCKFISWAQEGGVALTGSIYSFCIGEYSFDSNLSLLQNHLTLKTDVFSTKFVPPTTRRICLPNIFGSIFRKLSLLGERGRGTRHSDSNYIVSIFRLNPRISQHFDKYRQKYYQFYIICTSKEKKLNLYYFFEWESEFLDLWV